MPWMTSSVLEHLLVFYARHSPIRRGKLRIVNAFWEAVAGGRGTRRMATLKYGDFKMPCDIRQILQRQFYYFGTYLLAEDLIDCWVKQAPGARVILDVGANAGIFSLAALATEPAATVHAFEPTPEIAAGLRETAALNGLGHLHVHAVAVSSQNGYATLRRFRGELGTNEGMNFITAATDDPGAEVVSTVCLDRFCVDHGIDRVDLLKIDVQGHEHQALAGAARLLSAGRIGTVFTELNWSADPGTCSARASIQRLEDAGYRFSRPGRHLRWARSGQWLRSLRDVVARRPSSGDVP
jgi:FkbM family methyltransferase